MVLKGGLAVGFSDLVNSSLILLVELEQPIQVAFHGLSLDLGFGLLVSFLFTFSLVIITIFFFKVFAFLLFIMQRAILFPFQGPLAELDVATSGLLNSALSGAYGAGVGDDWFLPITAGKSHLALDKEGF